MVDTILPDQYLYARKGPWPQPSPSHPLKCADEVLNIPPMEELLFNEQIGARYLKEQVGYPPFAGMYSAENENWVGPTDERFGDIMRDTLYTRFKLPLTSQDITDAKPVGLDLSVGEWWKYDFTAWT